MGTTYTSVAFLDSVKYLTKATKGEGGDLFGITVGGDIACGDREGKAAGAEDAQIQKQRMVNGIAQLSFSFYSMQDPHI